MLVEMEGIGSCRRDCKVLFVLFVLLFVEDCRQYQSAARIEMLKERSCCRSCVTR